MEQKFMETKPKPSMVTLPVIITILLLVGAALAFFVVLLTFAPNTAATPPDGTVMNYTETVDRLLAMGNASRGSASLEKYACAACHRLAAGQAAPALDGLAVAAGERHPPLTAAEYLYESIVHPLAFVVEGFQPSMPQDYGTRVSEQDLADMLVYLVNGGT